MASWDSADLLARLQRKLRLPLDDSGNMVTQETTTTILYATLSDGQNSVFMDLAQRVPHAFISAPILLTSTDGNKTYLLKDATGATIQAGGHLKVFARLEDIPDRPLIEGYHYSIEGDQLRIPHNLTYTYGTGPYVQSMTEPVDITASQGLTIPTLCGRAVIARAAELFCKEGGLRDWSPHAEEYAREIAQICTRYRVAVTPSVQVLYGLAFSRGRGAVGR